MIKRKILTEGEDIGNGRIIMPGALQIDPQKEYPVTAQFDRQHLIGKAKLVREGNDIYAQIELFEPAFEEHLASEEMKDMYSFATTATNLETENNEKWDGVGRMNFTSATAREVTVLGNSGFPKEES